MFSQGLPRSRRLHLKNDFTNVIQTGRKIQGFGLVLCATFIGRKHLFPFFIAGFFVMKLSGMPMLVATMFGLVMAILGGAASPPVFAYCLTIQNHGDWDVNPPEQDLIHAQYDANPAMNDVLSEFLSCVSLSDQAFVDLCDYFRTVDRKVIVCMLGDHSPSFVEDITTKELGDRKEIAQATVPLVIWANFDLELTGELPERSVTADRDEYVDIHPLEGINDLLDLLSAASC